MIFSIIALSIMPATWPIGRADYSVPADMSDHSTAGREGVTHNLCSGGGANTGDPIPKLACEQLDAASCHGSLDGAFGEAVVGPQSSLKTRPFLRPAIDF